MHEKAILRVQHGQPSSAVNKERDQNLMKRLQLALAGAVVATLTVLAPSPAQAYPTMMCTVSDRVVTGGEDVTVTAQASPDTDSTTWTLSYEGQNRSRSGNPVTATFDTDEVDEPTQTTVTATVTNQAGDSSTCTGVIVLLPRDSDDDDEGDGDGDGGGSGDNGSLLPNTGGERLIWLIIGAMLVLVGGGVVATSRRRDA